MYNIGIDIGPEVTIVSRSPGYGNEKVSQISLKHKQYSLGRKIKTVICKINDEWSLCPHNEIVEYIEVTRNSWLDDTPTKEKENFTMFVKLLFQAIIDSDVDLEYDETTGKKNFDLIVGYPAYWEHHRHNATIQYRTFLKTECGLPVDCTSNEAEVRFREPNSLTFNERHNKIFVIDINFDTINFTGLPCWSNEYKSCWSLNLGTQRIVDTLMYNILRTDTNAQNLQTVIEFRKSLKFNGDIVHQLLLRLKGELKRYFEEGKDAFSFVIPFREYIPTSHRDFCIIYSVSDEEFNKLIFGYIQQVKFAIDNAKIRLSQYGWKPQSVFITGNWSVMLSYYLDLISYIEEIFEVKVYLDVCPETSISEGLALTRIIRV